MAVKLRILQNKKSLPKTKILRKILLVHPKTIRTILMKITYLRYHNNTKKSKLIKMMNKAIHKLANNKSNNQRVIYLRI